MTLHVTDVTDNVTDVTDNVTDVTNFKIYCTGKGPGLFTRTISDFL